MRHHGHDGHLRFRPRQNGNGSGYKPSARTMLLERGYSPIPCKGKIPAPIAWQTIRATPTDIAAWETKHIGATNTGILTGNTPAVDIDVTDPLVADAIYRHV